MENRPQSRQTMDTKDAGRLGGNKAAANMTPEARKERALKAAKARWIKRDNLTLGEQDAKPNDSLHIYKPNDRLTTLET